MLVFIEMRQIVLAPIVSDQLLNQKLWLYTCLWGYHSDPCLPRHIVNKMDPNRAGRARTCALVWNVRVASRWTGLIRFCPELGNEAWVLGIGAVSAEQRRLSPAMSLILSLTPCTFWEVVANRSLGSIICCASCCVLELRFCCNYHICVSLYKSIGYWRHCLILSGMSFCD